jgi:hypothetical protein
MRAVYTYYLAALFAIFTASCSSSTATGTFTAGGLGTGVLIGSAAGIVASGSMEAALDEQERKVMERSSPRTVNRMDRGDSLTLNDIIKLSQSGVTDDTIIKYLTDSGSTYHLTQPQVKRLQEGGVSQRVINFMIQSGK